MMGSRYKPFVTRSQAQRRRRLVALTLFCVVAVIVANRFNEVYILGQ